MAPSRYSYAPALDGVRGVSMVLFMAYHFGLSELTGMWVGINLFFVLSGFLIVRILTSEHSAHGGIDILGFYRRRVRRLGPALLLVLTSIAIWALFIAPEELRHRTGGDILATLAYVQNWRLLVLDDQYFADQGIPSPLRHAWTLSVEEQFYVLVPFLLLVLFRFVRSRRARAGVLFGLAGVSAVWSAVLGLHAMDDLPRLYYGTDVRAQSLLVGAGLGVLLARNGGHEPRLSRPVVLAAGAIGLASTIWSYLFIGPYTGWMYNLGGLLLFSLGSAALVVACADPVGNVFARVLGWRPFAYAGRRAYGLYLWHWPIHLWLGNDCIAGSVLLTGALGVLLTFVVAALSYRFIERPVIRGGLRALLPARTPQGAVVAAGLVPLVVLAAIGIGPLRSGSAALAAGAPPSAPSPTPSAAAGTASPSPSPTTAATPDPLHRPDTAPTGGPTGPIPDLLPGQPAYVPGRPARIALYGDSIALGMARGFPAAAYPDVSIAPVVQEGCDLLADPVYWAKDILQPNRAECTWLKEHWPPFVAERRSEVMVAFVSPFLTLKRKLPDGSVIWLDDPRYVQQVEAALEQLRSRARQSGVRRLVLVNNPCRPWLSADNWKVIEQDPKVIGEWKRSTRLNALVENFAGQHSDVQVIDLAGAICGPGRDGTVAGVSLTRDDIHFNPKAAPTIWKFVLGEVSAAR